MAFPSASHRCLTRPWLGLLFALTLSLPLFSPASTNSSGTPPFAEGVSSNGTSEATPSTLAVDPAILQVIDKMREATEASNRQHAEALQTRLKQLEDAQSAQRERDYKAMHESLQTANRTLLLGIAALVTLGLIGTALMGIFMFRSVHRLAEAVVAAPVSHRLSAPPPHLAGEAGTHLLGHEPPVTTPSSDRLLDAIGHLEKRIHELEHTAAPGLGLTNGHAQTRSVTVPQNAPPPDAPGTGEAGPPKTEMNRVQVLLEKGQAYLGLEQPEAAIRCFEEVVRLQPDHAEGHLKCGTALEKLERFDEALTSLDRALALDPELATAHLCKGSVLNRLDRHEDALKCYDAALKVGKAD